MIGVIDVGGGLRDIFGSGVFDYCLAHGIKFDYCIGISAGSANLASYLAGQKGRNVPFYLDYCQREEYMSMEQFLRTGSYINLDYVYRTLSNEGGEAALDYDRLVRNRAVYKIVATDANTGLPHYFDKHDMHRNDYRVICASCCLPVVCKPYVVDGVPYFDGGLSDPVPLEKAFSDGCDKVVVILTRPKDEVRYPERDERYADLFLKRHYPVIADGLCHRSVRYNNAVALAKRLEREGKALIIAPDCIKGLGTLTRDKTLLMGMYKKGLREAEKIPGFLEA
jgi:predicted patatin/cPLA2 family phospholipase